MFSVPIQNAVKPNLLHVDLDELIVKHPEFLMRSQFPAEFANWLETLGPILFFSKRPFPIAKEMIPFLWMVDAFEIEFERHIFLACESGASIWQIAPAKFGWDHLQSLKVDEFEMIEACLRKGLEFQQFFGRIDPDFQQEVRIDLNQFSTIHLEATFTDFICHKIPNAISVRFEGNSVVFAHPRATKLDAGKFIAKKFPELKISRLVDHEQFWSDPEFSTFWTLGKNHAFQDGRSSFAAPFSRQNRLGG